jgi:hypothetical protein
MRLPRFSIAGLMGLIVVVAVGVAALRFASELWAGILLMLTLGVLGASVLAFHERAGARRAWWRGFALFGWGYAVLALGPWASDAIAPNLPTTMGLDKLYERMHPEVEGRSSRRISHLRLSRYLNATDPSSTPLVDSSGARIAWAKAFSLATDATLESFRLVGHCLWALLVACVGGIVGRALHARGERTGSVPAPGPGVDPGP